MGWENSWVQVLMSTYQGERFLEEQIESLLSQSWKNLEILIRDDGSTDGTMEILERYCMRYSNIQVFAGENVGVAKSFFELLEESDGDFVAFCDQDDVWLEHKVEAAVAMLAKEQGPALYCGGKRLVDSSLEPIGQQTGGNLRPGFGNAVVECICTGCTAVLNRQLADILKARLPEHAILHDWWSYLAAAYVGKVIYDPEVYILYRQHEQNVVGAKAGFWGEVQGKAAYLRKNRGKLQGQLQDFSKLYQGDREKDALVRQVLAAEGLGGRLKIFCNRKIYRQKALDEVIMRILFLMGKML